MMRRFIALLVILVLGISIVRIRAQLLQSPPQVVFLSPTDEMPLDAPVTLMFNQAMNRQTVEAAWSVQPAVPGTFNWENDYTLVFTPAANWQRETTYTVTLTTQAASMDGQAFAEAYTADVKTAGYLRVSSVQPETGTTEVLPDAKFVVAFNRPVVPLVSTADMNTLPNPLTIEPTVTGHGEWLNTYIYQFTPDQPLAGATTYTATVSANLTDFNGTPVAEAYRWQFTTILPQIISVSPYSQSRAVDLASPVYVTFSQAMNRAATEASFQLSSQGSRVPGTFVWTDDSTSFTFTPQEKLQIATSYQLQIDKRVARSATGASLREGYSSTFDTPAMPHVVEGYPNEAYRVFPGWQAIRISFGTRMDRASVESAIVINPPPDEIISQDNGEYTFIQQFEFLPNTRYTVTVKGTARDVYGNALGADYHFSFNVQDTPAIVSAAQQAVLQQRFMVTGAYRRNTSVAVRVAGEPVLGLALYRVHPENIWQAFDQIYRRNTSLELLPLIAASEPVRNWTETLTPATDYAYMRVNLASPQGGALPPGVYLLTGIDRYPTMLAVTDSNITVKRTDEELFVWVTDMQTGAPLASQTISLYLNDQRYGEGLTDADGLFRVPVTPDTNNWLTIISQAGSHYGVWRSYDPGTMPAHDVYLYTDRPIYRPGETLYYRGTYRQRDDMQFFINNQNALSITVRDARGETLLEQPLQLNEFGSFSGEVELADTIATGQVYLYVSETGDDYQNWSAYAQVAEYRVPEYKVSVTAEQAEFNNGDTLQALVNTAYFSGGTVSNATVNWTVTGNTTGFRYTGQGRYSFVDWLTYQYDSSQRSIASAQAVTDAAGSFVIEIPDIQTQSMYPESLLIEASISDESGQSIAGRTTAVLHGTDTYIGVRTSQYFGRENEPFTAEIVAVSPQSEPIANEAVTLKLIERRWGRDANDYWISEDIEVASTIATTDESGKASYEFTPPNPGIFIVQAATNDYRSSSQIYVSGTSRYVRWGNSADTLTLIADKEAYSPGDTAQIFMQIPFEGASWALVTVERQGVMQYEVVKIEGSNLLYPLPITADHEPGVFVSVMLMHGIDATTTTSRYARQTLQLKVEPVNKRLTITISPSTTNARPGDVVTLDILAVDASGKPVKAEFGLALVDAAILSLAGPNSQSPEAHYYSTSSNQTVTDLMLVAASDGSEDELFGGETVQEVAIDVTATPRPPEYAPQERATQAAMGTETALPTATAGAVFALTATSGGLMGQNAMAAASTVAEADKAEVNRQDAAGVDVRSDFQQTPLWAAHVITDDAGRAQVSVTMPDNLTIWNLTARAITADTLIGEVRLDIASTLPLLVRPVVPRFFVVNDVVTLGMVINNNTAEYQDIRATLQGSGYTFIGNTTAEQTVLIAPNSREQVNWRVKIADVEGVDVTFVATGNDGYQDASRSPLAQDGIVPVYHYTAPDTVGTAGVLRDAGSRIEGVIIPAIADDGTLTVKIDHSLAATTLDSLKYLQNYPHQCIEQTVSRFLPNLITWRAMQKLNVTNPELDAQLTDALDFGVNRLLISQNYDGGWGWFPQMESNPYVSAYALLGLVEAQTQGYAIPPHVIQNATTYLRQQIFFPGTDSEWWGLNRQAFFFYVLAKVSPANVSGQELDRLLDYRVEMSVGARAYLLMTYVLVGGDNQIQTLAGDLKAAAFVSATGAHWEETSLDWWNWGSDVRTTSLVLMALLQVEPNNDLLSNAVRWLMVARRGDHWQSTQETTWAVMALTDWMVATQELEGNYHYSVALNDAPAFESQVTPETIRQGEVLTFEVRDLLMDSLNRVAITRDGGQGVLYYTTHLQLDLDAGEVDAINRGVGIQREYLINGQNVTSAQVGDVITVRLTVTVPETMYYFVVESPLPAGTEAVDYSLQTTTQSTRAQDTRYYWYYWLWDHLDIRDESVNLYADVLYPGTYVYSYDIRASVPGVFQVMPTHGFAFYFPEVFGRSDGEVFTVQ